MNGQRLREIGTERGEETAQKDEAYASGYQVAGKCMALFFPRGIPAGDENMMRAGLLFRTLDKLCREAHLIETGAPDAFGENPWVDCCGYAILGTALSEARKPAGAPTHSEERARDLCGEGCSLSPGHSGLCNCSCTLTTECVLFDGHSSDCVSGDGVRMMRPTRHGTCATPGCVRTVGHLDECLIGASGSLLVEGSKP